MNTPAQAKTTVQVPQKSAGEKPVTFIPFGGEDPIELTIKIIMDYVAKPTKTGKLCTARDAVNFLMLCKARRLNPFEGDAFLVGYDTQNGPVFSLITAHQAFLKRAESSPDYQGMDSGIILYDEETKEITERPGDFHLNSEIVVGGWAKVFHAKRPDHPTYRRVRLSRFDTGRAEWAKDQAGMIAKCAEADALRSTFPTLLGGMYMQGETIDVQSEAAHVPGPSFIDAPQQQQIANGGAKTVPKQETASQPQKETSTPAQDAETPSTERSTETAQSAEAASPTGEKPERPMPDYDTPQDSLKALMEYDGVNEFQMLGYLKNLRLIKPEVKSISELSPTKTVSLFGTWEQHAKKAKELPAQ